MITGPEYRYSFDELLDRPQRLADLSLLRGGIEDRPILITGAGGSIGSELSETILHLRPRTLILLEMSEHALYRVSMRLEEAASGLTDPPDVVLALGSVCDARLLDHLFQLHKPEVVYHAAAFKHVPLMEKNSFAAVHNNSVGTHTLAQAALRHAVRKVVLISTDKAVNPRSVMGASKRVAELVLLSLSNHATQMTSIRLCNVLGSQGSVAPLFREQIERDGPVTVTHPEVCRYFLTLREAVSRILEGSLVQLPGSILLPEMGEPIRILSLANAMIERYATGQIRIVYSGLRPGDKLEEELMTAEEKHGAVSREDFNILTGPRLSSSTLGGYIRELERGIELYDEGRLMTGLRNLVPEYSVAVESVR